MDNQLITLLHNLYYVNGQASVPKAELYRRAKAINPAITHQVVKEFLAQQLNEQLLTRPILPTQYNTIIAHHPRHEYQIDLMIYDRYEYRGYQYVLQVIDVYSRYLSSEPLKIREQETIVYTLEKVIFPVMGSPEIIRCDNEFNTATFRAMCHRHNIHPIYSYVDEPNKNAIVERVNGTIARMLQKWRIATGQANWPAVLPSIIKTYNASRHSTTKAAPIDIFEGREPNKQEYIILPPAYQPGDIVRINLIKGRLTKGDVARWSTRTYRITELVGHRYRLQTTNEDIVHQRLFKDYELLKVPSADADVPPPPPPRPPRPPNDGDNDDEEDDETAQQQRVRVQQKRRQRRTFGPGVGHEVAAINPEGQVTYKARMQPAAATRQRRAPTRYIQ